MLALVLLRFTISGFSAYLASLSYILCFTRLKMEADILPLHRGYSTENSDEDSKEWMLPTRGVEYAQVLFLEMDVQPSLLTQHHILKHLINVSTQSGEFADK